MRSHELPLHRWASSSLRFSLGGVLGVTAGLGGANHVKA